MTNAANLREGMKVIVAVRLPIGVRVLPLVPPLGAEPARPRGRWRAA